MSDRLLRIREVAERLAMRPRTLEHRVRAGTAPVMPCMGGGAGNRYRWRESDVARAIAQADEVAVVTVARALRAVIR